MTCPLCKEFTLLYTPKNGLERWTRIPEHPTNWISTFGRWYNETSNILRVPTKVDVAGYARFNICLLGGKKRSFSLHRLMGRLFLNVNSSHLHIHHIDRDKLNNQLCNLQAVTKDEHAKLHQNDIKVSKGAIKIPCYITHLDTKEEHFFPSISAAARFIGGRVESLYRVLKSKGKYRHCRRWTIRLAHPLI